MLIYGANLFISAIRWKVILHSLGAHLPLPVLLRLNLVGAFFNQVLPGAVSGDAVRAYYTRQEAGGMTIALAVVLAERLVGLAALLTLALIAYIWAGDALPDLSHLPLVLAGIVLAYLAGMAAILTPSLDAWLQKLGAIGEKLQKVRLAFRALFSHGSSLFWVLFWSFLVQTFSVLLFWTVAKALNLELNPIAIWVVWPLVTLFTVLPISLAGWGLREGLIVFYLSAMGVAADKALALSLLTGFAVLLAGLPGGVLWLRMGQRGQLQQVKEVQS